MCERQFEWLLGYEKEVEMAKCCYIGLLVLFMRLNGALASRPLFNQSSWKTSSDALIVPALVIFGDSTVDCGNNNYLKTIVKSNFMPYGIDFPTGQPTGRFCDGLLVTDYIAQKIGLPLGLPYLAPEATGEAILTGINFASSASGWYDNTAFHFNVKGLTDQFVWYKNWKAEVISLAGTERGNYIISNALYAFSTGTNDWVNNYYLNPNLMSKYTPTTYTTLLLQQVRNYVQELYDLGGRNMVVLGLPPIGCLPAQITLHGSNGSQDCIKVYNDVAVNFNSLLQVTLNDMKKSMHGARVIYVDIFSYIYNVFHDPKLYGYTYTRQGCCGTGDLEVSLLCNGAVKTCADPAQHIFWDSFHPTSHFYSQLADQMYAYAKPIILAPPQP